MITKIKIAFCFFIFAVCSSLLFNNCSKTSTSQSSTPLSSVDSDRDPVTEPIVEEGFSVVRKEDQARALKIYNESRQTVYNAKCAKYLVCYEGSNLPGEGASPYHTWSNPIDDHWPKLHFRDNVVINVDETDATGRTRRFLSVDRTEYQGPAWFSRVEDRISYESGLEVLLSIRIPQKAETNSFAVMIQDQQSHFAILFNHDSIVLNSQGTYEPREGQYKKINLRLDKGFQDFIIRKHPNSTHVELILVSGVEENKAKNGLLESIEATKKPAYDETFMPVVSFGGAYRRKIQDEWVFRAVAFDIDFLRFKPLQETVPVIPPELPALKCLKDMTYTHTLPLPTTLSTSGTAGLIKFPAPFDAPSLDYDASFEWTMKFKEHIPEGFVMGMLLGKRAYNFVLTGKTIQYKNYGKPVGSKVRSLELALNKTYTFRLVRPKGSIVAHLYLDGRELPVLSDIPGGSTGGSGLVVFGANTIPETSTQAWNIHEDILPLGRHLTKKVEILSLKLSSEAVGTQLLDCK